MYRYYYIRGIHHGPCQLYIKVATPICRTTSITRAMFKNENNSQLPSVGGNVELLNDFCVAGNVGSSQSKNPSVDVDQASSQSIEPGASNFSPSVVDGIVDVTFPTLSKQEPRLG